MIVKLIYLTSNLRYFEKEWILDRTWENESVMLKYQADLDDFLEKNGFTEFLSEKDLIEDIVFVRPLLNAV